MPTYYHRLEDLEKYVLLPALRACLPTQWPEWILGTVACDLTALAAKWNPEQGYRIDWARMPHIADLELDCEAEFRLGR